MVVSLGVVAVSKGECVSGKGRRCSSASQGSGRLEVHDGPAVQCMDGQF